MAGAEVNPGDSMPPKFINPFFGELIIKSPVLPTARSPQKEVIVLLNGIAGTFSFACPIIRSKPTDVAELSSLSSTLFLCSFILEKSFIF